MLAAQAQANAAGAEDCQVGAGAQQIAHCRSRPRDLLQVVQDEQEPLLPDGLGKQCVQGLVGTVLEAERPDYGRHDQFGVPQG